MKSPKEIRQLRAGAKELERRVQKNARESGTTVERVRLRIAALAVCGALSNATYAGEIPLYLVKGGLALELRFGYKARASKDIDVGIQAPADALPAILETALRSTFDSFMFSIKPPVTRTRSGAFRANVQVFYKDRNWSTVQIDLSEAAADCGVETLTHLSLDDFGLHAPTVNVLSINDQIAEKVHALTAPADGERRGERARDLVDIFLCLDFLDIDYLDLANKCEATFRRRLETTPSHEWPPAFSLPPDWRAPLERLARENELSDTSAESLMSRFSIFIARLCGERVEMIQGYEYYFEEIGIGDHNTPSVESLNARAKDGWRIINSFVYPGNNKRMFVLLERSLAPVNDGTDGVIGLPFLNIRLTTSTPGGGAELLSGELQNGGHSVASAIRGAVTGVDEILRIGTLTPRDAAIPVGIRINDSQLRMQGQLVQFPAIMLQYRAENGKIYEQAGPLDRHGPDASGRYSYSLNGLRAPREIAKFTFRLDMNEIV